MLRQLPPPPTGCHQMRAAGACTSETPGVSWPVSYWAVAVGLERK